MAVYTVHEPRPRRNEDTAAPERYAFVRDGFYVWAFLLGPLWMLWHRLWLVLVLYIAAMGGLEAGMWALGLSGAAPQVSHTAPWGAPCEESEVILPARATASECVSPT